MTSSHFLADLQQTHSTIQTCNFFPPFPIYNNWISLNKTSSSMRSFLSVFICLISASCCVDTDSSGAVFAEKDITNKRDTFLSLIIIRSKKTKVKCSRDWRCSLIHPPAGGSGDALWFLVWAAVFNHHVVLKSALKIKKNVVTSFNTLEPRA